MPWKRRALPGLLASILLLAPLMALAGETLPAPKGRVILTIEGRIERTNAPGKALWDSAMLNALGSHRLVTHTPWTDGATVFTGVLARDVLDAVGAKGTSVLATAVDDYASEVPIQDFYDYPVILAMSMNGQELSPRDKGALWIIYPLDDISERELVDKISHAVWQLIHFRVK